MRSFLFISILTLLVIESAYTGKAHTPKNWKRAYEQKAIAYYDAGKSDSASYCFRIVAHLAGNDSATKALAWLNIALIESENKKESLAKAALQLGKLHTSNLVFDKKLSVYHHICEAIVNNDPQKCGRQQKNRLLAEPTSPAVLENMLQWQIQFHLIKSDSLTRKTKKQPVNSYFETLRKITPPASYRYGKIISAEANAFIKLYNYTEAIQKLRKSNKILSQLGLTHCRLNLENNVGLLICLPVSQDQTAYAFIDSVEKDAHFFNDSASLSNLYAKRADYAYANNREQSYFYICEAIKFSKHINPYQLSMKATVAQILNKDSIAIACFKELSKFPGFELQSYSGIGLSLYKMNHSTINNYYDRIIKKMLISKKISNFEFAWANYYYHNTNQINQLNTFRHSFQNQLEKEQPKSVDLSNEYINFGNICWFKNADYQKALDYYHKALLALLPGEHTTNYYADINTNGCLSQRDIVNAFNNKGEAFYQLSKTRKVQEVEIRDLKACYKNLALSIDFIFANKMSKTTEEQKYIYSNLNASKYPNLIKVCLELFNKTRDPLYKNLAFKYAEQSKAAVLLSMLRSNDGSKIGLIPKAYKLTEDSLNYELNLINHMLTGQITDSVKLALNFQIGKVARKRQTLEDMYRKKYPSYFQLKNSPFIISPQEVQKNLKKDECVLEYLLTKNFLILYYFDKQKFIIKTDTLKNVNLASLAEGFYQRVQSFHIENYKPDSIKQYADEAYALYSILIKPFEKEINGKKIIIIGDNILNQLPFEALLTEKPKNPKSYKNLPYLIKKNAVSYAPSFAFLGELRKRPQIDRKAKLLAIAPIYSSLKLNDTISRSLLAMRSDTSLLSALPNAKKEIKFAHKMAGGRLLKDKDASETEFKSIAQNYDILHLATHGLVNNVSPLQSKLLFADSKEQPDDGFLHTYEIYNLQQSSQLVILSACNTGVGKNYGGEGMISLARGFLSSGSRSVMMTLWSVNDMSSSHLIQGFYKHMKDGKPLYTALTESKIDYLNTTDNLHSHPYFWTGYAIYGDASVTLRIFNNGYLHLTFLLIALVAIMTWLYIRKNRLKSLIGNPSPKP